MKKVILTALFLFSTNALAAENFSEYQLLEIITKNASGTRKYFANKCMEEYISAKKEAMALDNTKCSHIIVNSSISTVTDLGKIPTPFTYGEPTRKNGSIIVEVYCKQRSFSEMTLVSLFKKCQDNPQQECFDPQLIARLDQVKPTVYKENLKGNCR